MLCNPPFNWKPTISHHARIFQLKIEGTFYSFVLCIRLNHTFHTKKSYALHCIVGLTKLMFLSSLELLQAEETEETTVL
jgi:hypothetical protein